MLPLFITLFYSSNNIVIVGTVMAQTVALDYYAVAVERMLENFMHMNVKIEESGNFDSLVSPLSINTVYV